MEITPFVKLLSSIAKPEVRFLKKEELLFLQGDIANHIYAVKEGCIKLVRYTIEGYSVTIHTAYAGESFAEAALFSETYHCNADTVLPSTILCYSKIQILEMLQTHTDKYKNFIALLTSQIHALRTRLELRSIRSAHQRIFQSLLLQADPKTLEIKIKGSYKDMAHELGLTHESLYRSLAKLEKETIIQRKGSSIKILKPAVI